MSKLDFSAAVRSVIAEEVNHRLAPYRELLDRLAAMVQTAASDEDFVQPSRPAQPSRPRRAGPVPRTAEVFSVPKPPVPPREPVVRRIPAYLPRGAGGQRREVEAQGSREEPEIKVQAVKPFVRRRATSESTNGAEPLPVVDPFDARIAKRFSVGQSVRYRSAEGLVTAKVAAIDGITGILTLLNPRDDTRLTIPASNVFAAV